MKKTWLVLPSVAMLIIGVPGLASAGGTHSAKHHSYVSPAGASPVHKLVLTHPAHPFQTHPLRSGTKFNTVSSNNWSGFAVYGDHFRFVRATYTIPSLNCSISPDGSYDSQWVGLDGYSDKTVEQIGTYAQCSGGTPSYFGFYEMYPAPSVAFSGVSAGDSITVSVYYDRSTSHWTLKLYDNTIQAPLTESLSCPSGSKCWNASAEVISEVPNGGPPAASLADYGTVGFTQIGIADTSGHSDNVFSPYWKNDKVFEVDASSNHEMQEPSKLEGGRSGSGGGYGNQAFTDTAVNPN